MAIKKAWYFAQRQLSNIVRPVYYGLSYGQFNKDFLKMSVPRKLDMPALKKKSRAETEPLAESRIFKRFSFKMPHDFIHEVALETQVYLTGKTDYVRGYLIYSLLRQAIEDKGWHNPMCFEMGTATGFSSLCMAKALEDTGSGGKVLTIDLLPVHGKINWNINRYRHKQTRAQFLQKWQGMIESYIIYVQSYSDLAIKQMLIPRISFAYLDAEHTYDAVKRELEYVRAHQKKGDLILCDDYTPAAFPGVAKAIDEFARRYKEYRLEVLNLKGSRIYALLERRS